MAMRLMIFIMEVWSGLCKLTTYQLNEFWPNSTLWPYFSSSVQNIINSDRKSECNFLNTIAIVHAMAGMHDMYKLYVHYLEQRSWTHVEV